ncbi:hypothetical protein XELAEV_18002473mg [Xenopus laevis]|nr:hypothetical protein XELAEV_18002473mg [Xenopus laevis]
MGVWKRLLRSKNLLLAILVPLLLLPLPLLHPSSESSCAYVLIVTAVYWVSEAVPLGAAALVPAFLFPLFGVLKSSQVAGEYVKNTTLLLMGVICLAASVEKWNLHKRIALRMVMLSGAKPGRLLLCFMSCTALLSMWLSNTSSTAMVMPIVEAVLQQLINTEEEHEGIVANGSSATEPAQEKGAGEKQNQPSIELIFINEEATAKDLSKLIQSKNLNGVHMIANPILMKPPTNGQSLPQTQILVLPPTDSKNQKDKGKYQSRHDHMICKCLSLSVSYAATIGGLTTIIGTSTSLIFLEHFKNRYPDAEVVNFGTWFVFSVPITIIFLLMTWVWMHWLFLGYNFKETCSFSKKTKTKREELSERRIQEEYEKLGDISYPEKVTIFFFVLMTVLWFTREPGFVPGWESLFEKKGFRTDATVSVLLGFLLFLIPSKKPTFLCFRKKEPGEGDDSEEDGHTDSMLTWPEFQRHMPWEIVVLVGGGYALAAGCKTSGLSTWIGRQMECLSSLPSWAVTLLACTLVSAVTELVSNPATVTIFLPILCSLSEALHINPLYTLIPVTMCISLAVMLPVGNPPNAIVYNYGHCHIRDMVKAGLGVNLIGLAIIMVAINTWGISLFQLDTFPDWAKVGNATGRL